jgi:glycerol kinase
MAGPLLLAIDQGTTGTRAVVYDAQPRSLGTAARELRQFYPQPGWVEHDVQEIWDAVQQVVAGALALAGVSPSELAGIGITNQRETSVLWERSTGRPVGRALVWQDRRTTDFCRQRKADEPWIQERTGLVLDPYFSATKFRWMLDQDPFLAGRARDGAVAGGTMDSFLIWRLTGGQVHATDVTNASRTLLLNLQNAAWDEDLCRFFGVPEAMLPEVRPSAGVFGFTKGLGFLPDGIPIAGVAGDQQAALFGQCGFAAGDAKCTYGTGAFFLQHTGDKPIRSRHRLLGTVAATLGKPTQYALEGSVFVAGAAVQWLRDGLRLLSEVSQVEDLAAQSDPNQPILFVPGLVGLGAPYWIPEARGVLFGLTRSTTAADLGRAALEGVAFQVADLIGAAGSDAGKTISSLRVDGGMARNQWFLQRQADVLGMPVIQAPAIESTALGAAFLAGLQVGVWPDLDTLSRTMGQARRFEPHMPAKDRRRLQEEWHRAVGAVIAFYQHA